MDKIKLFNGSIFQIENNIKPNKFTIISDNNIDTILSEITNENNLQEIYFLNNDEDVYGIYYNQKVKEYTINDNLITVEIADIDLCYYRLILDDNFRIINFIPKKYATDNMYIVDTLPQGKITDYLYINNEYIYDPLVEEKSQTMTKEDDIDSMLIDHEYRLTLLELNITE